LEELILQVQTLKLSDITSKFCSVTMSVIVDVQTIFYTQFAGTIMIHLHTKFHMSSFSVSLITIKSR